MGVAEDTKPHTFCEGFATVGHCLSTSVFVKNLFEKTGAAGALSVRGGISEPFWVVSEEFSHGIKIATNGVVTDAST